MHWHTHELARGALKIMVFATKVAAGKARCAEEATSLVCVMAPDLHAWHGSWSGAPLAALAWALGGLAVRCATRPG